MSSVVMPAAVWKEEPLSPLSGDEGILFDATFYQDTLEQFDIKFETDLTACESKAEVASHILEDLENLVDLDELIKEESYLLDEKMLPMLDEVEPPRAIPVPLQNIKSEYMKPHDTQYLLKEFETVYDVVELAHGTLTPPQSPPSELTTLEPLLTSQATYPIVPTNNAPIYSSVPEKQLLQAGFCTLPIDNPMDISYQNCIGLRNSSVMPHQPTDIARELAVVDELVRSRVEDMQWSSGNSCSSSSPGSPGGSSCSNFGDCSSDDPEWVPETVEHCNEISTKTARKRSKPYSKAPPEEKKVRKKEQNKNAATRYRLKKKAEVEEILTEEKILLNKSTDLGGQITDLQREIKYLKGLMRDLFKAKGLIN